jgi:hypothetical protein
MTFGTTYVTSDSHVIYDNDTVLFNTYSSLKFNSLAEGLQTPRGF